MSETLLLVLAGAWLAVAVALGIGRAAWCGYTGDESEPFELAVFLVWPLWILVPPFVLAVTALSSPFMLAHWVAAKFRERRAK